MKDMITRQGASRPGRLAGFRADILDWARWCLYPKYALGDGEATRAQFAAVKTRIVAKFEQALWSTYLIPELCP